MSLTSRQVGGLDALPWADLVRESALRSERMKAQAAATRLARATAKAERLHAAREAEAAARMAALDAERQLTSDAAVAARAAQVERARAAWQDAIVAERQQPVPGPRILSREQLFPPCQRSDCAQAGTPHSELLPHQQEGFDAPERFVAMLGGYGSAKTQWAVALGVALSLQIPGNVGFVLRRSYPKLRDSVLRVYLDTLDRLGIRYETGEHEQGMPHRLVLPEVGSEIRFRESANIGRLLSTECGWFHLEEAAEDPKATWGHLVGRLRLRAARGYLKGILTSNPPTHQHWLAEVFGMTPGSGRRVDPLTGDTFTTRLILVSSRQNPHLPAGYVAALVTTHAAHDVRRLVDGQFGFMADGAPVYPQFDLSKHVRAVPLLNISVVRSWDFGFKAPAVVWSQFPKCHHGRVHWHIVSEYAGRELEAEGLADVVLEQTKALWAQYAQDHPAPVLVGPEGQLVTRPTPPIVDCGDAAGAPPSDRGQGPIKRLRREPYRLAFAFKQIPNVDPGLALIRLMLSEADCACGEPTVLVSQSCRHVIDMFMGGYHFKDLKPTQAHTEASLKPHKDGFYDNLADALRYAIENHYRRLRRDPHLLADLGPRVTRATPLTRGGAPASGTWGWMEGTHHG